MLNEIEVARKKAENTLGFEIPIAVAAYILEYTMRKFQNIVSREEKPEGYLGILYQNEIEDFFRRSAMTAMSAASGRESAYVC